MPCCIGGSFTVAHASLLEQALRAHGIHCISDHPSLHDPFALLLHRIQHPDALVLTCRTDTESHPEIQRLVTDLAQILLPEPIEMVTYIDMDQHELFYHLLQTGFTGTFSEMMIMMRNPLYARSSEGTMQQQIVPGSFSHLTPVHLQRIVQAIVKQVPYISTTV